jgi:hydrogenase maturation protease
MGSGVLTFAEELAPLVARPWLLVGVGSDLRGDDAFGPRLARRLAQDGLPSLDAGTSPESLTGPIVRSGAEVLILADIGHLGAPPGTLRLLAPDAVLPGGTSTHDPSLSLLISYLQAQRPFLVRILAVEPVRRGLGAPVSGAVLAAIERAAEAFRDGVPDRSRHGGESATRPRQTRRPPPAG